MASLVFRNACPPVAAASAVREDCRYRLSCRFQSADGVTVYPIDPGGLAPYALDAQTLQEIGAGLVVLVKDPEAVRPQEIDAQPVLRVDMPEELDELLPGVHQVLPGHPVDIPGVSNIDHDDGGRVGSPWFRLGPVGKRVGGRGAWC
jgi:hypothetical protein